MGKENNEKCPLCKRVAIDLVALFDDGKGERYCHKCKRNARLLLVEKGISFSHYPVTTS